MDKTNFIQMLLDDIAEEKEYFNEYIEAKEDCERARKNQGEDFRYYEHPYYKMRVPSRQKIKDDCKMIRRLALEISREEI